MAPRRTSLGQGAPRALAEAALGALAREAAVVRGELSSALGPPGGSDIPLIGGRFSRGQILTQVAFDARTVADAARSLAGGAAAGWMSPDQLARAEGIAREADALAAAVPLSRAERIPPELEPASLEHNEAHAEAVRGPADDAERAAAAAEAREAVPLTEPSERAAPVAAAAAVAGLALLVVLLTGA